MFMSWIETEESSLYERWLRAAAKFNQFVERIKLREKKITSALKSCKS